MDDSKPIPPPADMLHLATQLVVGMNNQMRPAVKEYPIEGYAETIMMTAVLLLKCYSNLCDGLPEEERWKHTQERLEAIRAWFEVCGVDVTTIRRERGEAPLPPMSKGGAA